MAIHPQPKPSKTRRQLKARQARQETQIKKLTRAACVVRDGDCRLLQAEFLLYECSMGRVDYLASPWHAHNCDAPYEWAHFGDKRRSRTRGQAAEIRHTTAGSLMLCKSAHEAYDAGRLKITALTRHGCDGRLKFALAKGETL